MSPVSVLHRRFSKPLERLLTHMPCLCILMHMRTTINIDDAVLERARRLSGIKEKTALVHAALDALIAREAGRRLAALGGSDRAAKAGPRRRSRPRRAAA
jgi:Arc/MetJ family transcription regulator